ncbi:hypothetical protein GCM10010216_02570 [Streptomyces flaveolus]|nr:hypothetical protein GCM10010216_02570 [Streptomyces flaveolus]
MLSRPVVLPGAAGRAAARQADHDDGRQHGGDGPRSASAPHETPLPVVGSGEYGAPAPSKAPRTLAES